MAAGNPDFSTLVSSSIKNYRKELMSNILGQQALWWQLEERDFVTEDEGGTSIVEPILYGQNSTVKAFKDYDLIDLTPQEGMTSAEYEWKHVVGAVSISGTEEFKNQGPSRIFKLLDGKIQQLEESMQLSLNRQLFADGTGEDGKELTGLGLAVEDGSAWSSYGGIDSSDSANSWWRNQYINFTSSYTSFPTDSGTSVEGMDAIRSMTNLCTRGKSRPTLIITTRELYEAYEAYVEGAHLRTEDKAMADAGFDNVAFRGIPIIFDEDMDTNQMLFLNSRYIKLVTGKGRKFKVSPFASPPNQDARSMHVILTAQLVMGKRDQHGRITNFTPS